MAARLIFNPAAGQGKAQALFAAIQPYLDDTVEVVRTQGPGHATELAREVADREDLTVISLGGDGTHHEVINGLMPLGKVIFAVLPAGTGNDFVRILSYPKTPREMLEVALRGQPQSIDIGLANDQYFLTVSGVGFDAEVAGWVNAHDKKGNGTWIFLRGILRHLVRYQSAPMTVFHQDQSESQNTFMLAAGNTRYYAGGMSICPQAVVDDGRFQVIWVKDLPRLGVLPLLARVFWGTHVHHAAVKSFDTDALRIEGPPEMLVHADGEIIGHLPVTMSVIHNAIRVRMGG
jgi:YegS/Rv2252/BmrU family lipid kinase